jgi:ABC-type dipeptide/oligopeptide/nickel transport system permease subunit
MEGVIGGVIVLLLLLVGYFLPFIIALARKHVDSTAIFVLNLFLGWTFFGWVVALVWAVKKFEVKVKNSAN